MNFLKTAFWVIIAVALALFAKANWVIVTVKLWGDTVLDARLPVLIVLAFLLGLVPTWLWSRALRWSLQRKLTNTERALANAVPTTTLADGSVFDKTADPANPVPSPASSSSVNPTSLP